jgi:hypothetical protein
LDDNNTGASITCQKHALGLQALARPVGCLLVDICRPGWRINQHLVSQTDGTPIQRRRR